MTLILLAPLFIPIIWLPLHIVVALLSYVVHDKQVSLSYLLKKAIYDYAMPILAISVEAAIGLYTLVALAIFGGALK